MSDSITREEQYLNAIANGESIDLKPITREEQFLAKAAGQDVKTPTPITRREIFLSKISSGGSQPSGGNYSIADRLAGIGPAKITEADFEGITEIKERAFSSCSGMTTVELPSTITKIGERAFANCKDIETVKYKVNARSGIAAHIFDACAGLKTVIFDASVIYIPSRMCEGCTNLENIVFPEGMLAFNNLNSGSYVFKGCTGLKTLNLPSTSGGIIPTSMFEGCTGLTDLTFPASISRVNANAFSGCTGLTSVTFQESETDGSLYIGGSAFQNCTSLVSVVLTNQVTEINDLVFRDCSSLTNIVIPESVKIIKLSAFYLCTSLTNLTIPASVSSIQGYALHIGDTTNKATIRFLGTTPPSIQSSTIGDNVEKIIVPVGCGDIYKSATNFSAKADIIEEDAE